MYAIYLQLKWVKYIFLPQSVRYLGKSVHLWLSKLCGEDIVSV